MVKSSQRSTYNTSTICSPTSLISRRRLPESGMQDCGRLSEASTFKSKEELVQAIQALHENSSSAVTFESSSANLQHNSRCLSGMLHRHHHLFLNHKGRWGTTADFATSFLHFSLFFTALGDLANSRPVHSLMLSSHLFLCLPCILPPLTVPCKMVLARPDEQETCPYHYSLHLFTMVRRSLCGPSACWILAWTSLLVTWSLYDMCSILR